MKLAYLVSIAFMRSSKVESSAAVIISDKDPALVQQALPGLVRPDDNILDIQIGEMTDDLLTALAKLAKEKGLVE